MAGSQLNKRVEALEGARDAILYPVAWIITGPDETAQEARARYEAKHGPIGERSSITWVQTGVPRSEGALCV